jgi:hypothetical protein
MVPLDTRLRASLVAHGVVVIILGLLAGFPFAMVITGDLQGDLRAWRMAHLEGVLNGLVMVGVGAAGGVIQLARSQARWLWAGLLAAGYGNVVASVIAAACGVRGLAPTAPPSNLLVFLLFTAAIVGVFVGLGLAALGAFRHAARGD